MKLCGIGVGAMMYGLGYGFSRPDFSSTDIELAPDGTITMWNGASELGQGLQTLLCQFAAQELGIPYEDTYIISADTGRTPDAGPVSASRSTYVQGNSVLKACRDLKIPLAELAGQLLQVDPGQLVFKHGLVYGQQDPSRSITFRSLAGEMHKRGLKSGAAGTTASPPQTSTTIPPRETLTHLIPGQANLLKWKWIPRRARWPCCGWLLRPTPARRSTPRWWKARSKAAPCRVWVLP